jgi:L-alanine-DL-glutamate epimerase-like enolase superfamily enzyme
LASATSSGLVLECFEQPCARGDEAAHAELARTTDVPIVADESLRGEDDLRRIVAERSARGVNLKLVKLGGLVRALDVGEQAKAAGLSIMCGAMVETRLGLTAMMHVASALGGADFVDLDTQLLLTHERFVGGYDQDGPRMTLRTGAGFALEACAPNEGDEEPRR